MPKRSDLIAKAAALPVGDPERKKILAAIRVAPDIRALKRKNGGFCPFCFMPQGQLVYMSDSYGGDHGSDTTWDCENCGATWTDRKSVV